MERCLCCEEESNELAPEGGYCPKCWDDVVTPAYRHVENLSKETGCYHHAGWAVREAFIAGAASQIKKTSGVAGG